MADFDFQGTIDTGKIDQLMSEDEILIGYIAGMPTSNGLNVDELAKMLSYGTSTIPARPHLEEGILDGESEVSKAIEKHYKARTEGDTSQATLHNIGAMAVGAVKKFVMGDYYRSTVPNAPSTIYQKSRRQKGKVLLSDKPLIDNAHMVQSVTYLINSSSKD
jgi:hypothetical protein